jgi:hypothetical protein
MMIKMHALKILVTLTVDPNTKILTVMMGMPVLTTGATRLMVVNLPL